ncbi:WD repeat-containing protein 12 [Ancistrocladus abbreviatus]
MDMDGGSEENVKRVQVRFVTKLQPPLKVPNTAIAIPSNLTRLGLSTVVNNLLKAANSDWEAEPFDFLIDGELVRMSLEEFLIAKDISAEKILEIEYINAVVPQKQEDPSLHDDWVTAVDGSHPAFIMTGCCDRLGRIWKGAGMCTHVLEGHSDAVTSVSIINTRGSESADQICLATGSDDRTVRLWKFNADFHSKNKLDAQQPSVTLTSYKILRAHNASVKSVSSQPSGNMVCSGSWDATINLWQMNESDTDGDLASVKKRKTDDAVDPLIEGGAVSTLVGHTQCVPCVVWPRDEAIYSASWDHSVRRWDVETGKDSWNLFCGKALNCVDVGGESSALVAAGASDTILRIWDPRKPGTLTPIFQFSSHTSWISACKWHNKSWFHLLSASYDGKVMLWDLRTAWPLAVIDSHTDKVLCADWWKGDSIVSGGADAKLCIASGISL